MRMTRAMALWRDTSGAALTEFALGLPILFFLGMAGIEYANYGRTQLLVSQITQTLADNASRVGLTSNLAATQLRESDINAVLTGARLQGAGIKLTTYGRITLSSLENVQQTYDTTTVQRIHWQRCIGLKSGTSYDSTYGTTSTTAGTTATLANAGTTKSSGMGDNGYLVSAPSGGGVMFVEVNFLYQPLFSSMFISSSTLIHSTASFVVRDQRDFSMVYNTSPVVTRYTCDRNTAS
ncbi:hypothetical protein GTZ99_15155 [Novosphingobium sp. FSY-8]|uniref:TadE-like domain-containing protein n=1 Tax=Novosphingobium ovatum TaxID=1908523 RepID=A0ABW9XHK1_9SPHN|nr:TadE/TadG family type IV pilus assembly protein [Novosphingobium ovatum]NBC37892.1 hypothetical protein [Novosphingobium ovatum]